MAIQFGTVDGLLNITEENIFFFVRAIDEFCKLGGPTYAQNAGVSYGSAFQRFTEAPYQDNTVSFAVDSINNPVTTRNGKEQSPARVTFCRKMGLLKIDESYSIFELTPLGKSILDGDISIKEYAFILISKIGIFKDGNYVDNVFSVLAEYFKQNPSISSDSLKVFLNKRYNDSEIEKTRFDIILNALDFSGFTVKINGDMHVLSNTEYAYLMNDFYSKSSNVRIAIHDTDAIYSEYLGEIQYGIFDVLDAKNYQFYDQFFPNLKKYMQTNNKQNNGIGDNLNRQIIFYGAPGTGKSNTVKREVEDKGKIHFRTTFHPDSDYSTFVGCYKPTMKVSDKIYSQAELVLKLKEIKNSGVTYPCHKFAAKYWKSLKDLSANDIKQILAACNFTEAFAVEIAKGVAIGQDLLNKSEDGKIIYSFIPQAFTNAYVKAWNTSEEVYLIIEEINRGNCAQIFGDLFQLLDRKNGFSEYPVEADTDLADHIAKELQNSQRTDIPDDVKSGKLLILPSNLYIWATMNTSDQSLFPIDSAFKRRWDWKYIKIKKGKEEFTGNDLEWKIKAVTEHDWWGFVESVNEIIYSMTSSADKQLGFFFCQATNNVIDAEAFVNKVAFYLWNDVFKDYAEESSSLFKFKKRDDDIEDSDLTFPDFFDDDGVVVPRVVERFIQNVKNWKKDEKKQEE